MSSNPRLSHILAYTQAYWDREGGRPEVIQEFRKVVACRTLALGAEVFTSDAGEDRVVPHTCKSRTCASCGQRQNLQWLRERWADLPEMPYSHVVLTMPDHFWPVFRANRHLLRDLPALGAAVLQQWVRQTYGADLLIAVVPHTFGRDLKFNCHLHVMVSHGGLGRTGQWMPHLDLYMSAIMKMWRYAVITLLREAYRQRALTTEMRPEAFANLLDAQYRRRWHVHCGTMRSKGQILRYAGRYVRRPPLAEHRIRSADADEVRFLTKDLKTRTTVETSYSVEEFIDLLSHHVPDRYAHNVRYFGLLAPRSKGKNYGFIYHLLGQHQRSKPRRIPWAESLQRCFGINPLVDSTGRPMHWVRRLSPA